MPLFFPFISNFLLLYYFRIAYGVNGRMDSAPHSATSLSSNNRYHIVLKLIIQFFAILYYTFHVYESL